MLPRVANRLLGKKEAAKASELLLARHGASTTESQGRQLLGYAWATLGLAAIFGFALSSRVTPPLPRPPK